MISAYNPQVYQDKPIQYNYKIDGVNRLLQLKNSLYEQNYEYIKGLKSSTLGIHFLNENGNKEVKTIQDNVDNFFKTHDINKYDVGDAAIANEFTNQFKSLESNRSLQELYRVDKALQQDLSSVNSLRTDKDREKKGYSTGNHELFAIRLEEYSKLDKSTAIARGAESFRYVPYTNTIPDISSIAKMIPITERHATLSNGTPVILKGKDPLDIYRALTEMLPEGAKKQLAVAGELEARRALRNGATVEQLYKTAILPRTSPIIMSNLKRLEELNLELKTAVVGGDPKKEAEAQSKIADIKQKIEKIKSDTDMSNINKMSQDQFINYYSQISVDHQLEHIANSFGEINQTMNMAALALQQKDEHFRIKTMQEYQFHKDDMKMKEMTLALKQKEVGLLEPENNGSLGPTIPATANASVDLSYDQFNATHTEVNKNAEPIYNNPDALVSMALKGELSKSSNIYAKAANIFLEHPLVANLPGTNNKQKMQIFASLVNEIKKGDYEGINTELKNQIYSVLRPTLDYQKMYDAKWNAQVANENAVFGLKSSKLLNEADFNALMKQKRRSDKYNDGTKNSYIGKISLGTQQSISNNYTVTTPEVQNPKLAVNGLPKAQKDVMASDFNYVTNNIRQLISSTPIADNDGKQVVDVVGNNLIKSVKVTPNGYLVTFIDDKTITKTDGDDEESTTTTSITKDKFIVLKSNGKKIPINQGEQLIPFQIGDKNLHLTNMAIANSPKIKPLEHTYKGKTLQMYNDNGFKYMTNILDPITGKRIDLTSLLINAADPVEAFQMFVNTLNQK